MSGQRYGSKGTRAKHHGKNGSPPSKLYGAIISQGRILRGNRREVYGGRGNTRNKISYLPRGWKWFKNEEKRTLASWQKKKEKQSCISESRFLLDKAGTWPDDS